MNHNDLRNHKHFGTSARQQRKERLIDLARAIEQPKRGTDVQHLESGATRTTTQTAGTVTVTFTDGRVKTFTGVTDVQSSIGRDGFIALFFADEIYPAMTIRLDRLSAFTFQGAK